MAEIHGMVEISSNTNTAYSVQGFTNKFWFSLTNNGNVGETNLLLILTNYKTNIGPASGNWIIGLLDAASKVIFKTNSYSFTSYIYKVTNLINIASEYRFGVFLTPSSNTAPASWASVDLKAALSTPYAAKYSVTNAGSTNLYGGFTNIYKKCKVIIGFPNISLSKVIENLTNVITGGKAVMPGCEISYLISFSNSGSSSGRDLKIIDILPPKYVMLSNSFILSGYATNFKNNIETSRDNGFIWINTMPGWNGWATNIDQIRFTSDRIIPAGTKGSVRYKVRIK